MDDAVFTCKVTSNNNISNQVSHIMKVVGKFLLTVYYKLLWINYYLFSCSGKNECLIRIRETSNKTEHIVPEGPSYTIVANYEGYPNDLRHFWYNQNNETLQSTTVSKDLHHKFTTKLTINPIDLESAGFYHLFVNNSRCNQTLTFKPIKKGKHNFCPRSF